MISTYDDLKKAHYIFERVSAHSKRLVAINGDIMLFQCSDCNDFKTKDLFHKNASQPYGILNMCRKCNNLRKRHAANKDSNRRRGNESPSRKAIKEQEQSEHRINFFVADTPEGYKIMYYIGNSFDKKEAPVPTKQIYYEARNSINKKLRNKVIINEGLEHLIKLDDGYAYKNRGIE